MDFLFNWWQERQSLPSISLLPVVCPPSLERGAVATPLDESPSFKYCAVTLTRLAGMVPLRSEPSSRSATLTA